MPEFLLAIGLFAMYMLGYFFGKSIGYQIGFIDGKHDMLNFINKNTRTKEINIMPNPVPRPRPKPPFPGTNPPTRPAPGPGKPRP